MKAKLDPDLRREFTKRWFDIKVARELGEDITETLELLENDLGYPHLSDHFISDLPNEQVIEYAWMWQPEWPKLSRTEMIDLVERISRAEGSEAEIHIMVNQFEANCVHPAKGDLIYYPAEVFGEGVQPTAEEIVDKAIQG